MARGHQIHRRHLTVLRVLRHLDNLSAVARVAGTSGFRPTLGYSVRIDIQVGMHRHQGPFGMGMERSCGVRNMSRDRKLKYEILGNPHSSVSLEAPRILCCGSTL